MYLCTPSVLRGVVTIHMMTISSDILVPEKYVIVCWHPKDGQKFLVDFPVDHINPDDFDLVLYNRLGIDCKIDQLAPGLPRKSS